MIEVSDLAAPKRRSRKQKQLEEEEEQRRMEQEQQRRRGLNLPENVEKLESEKPCCVLIVSAHGDVCSSILLYIECSIPGAATGQASVGKPFVADADACIQHAAQIWIGVPYFVNVLACPVMSRYVQVVFRFEPADSPIHG